MNINRILLDNSVNRVTKCYIDLSFDGKKNFRYYFYKNGLAERVFDVCVKYAKQEGFRYLKYYCDGSLVRKKYFASGKMFMKPKRESFVTVKKNNDGDWNVFSSTGRSLGSLYKWLRK